uniref:Uncharacterized protein n=1 Tax=Bacillus cereus HuA4-10 TaxID=1053206 RepID=J8CN24_BACCE|nr:hypothetical protein IGC_04979 [Bacillus cereus HuA4-10]
MIKTVLRNSRFHRVNTHIKRYLHQMDIYFIKKSTPPTPEIPQPQVSVQTRVTEKPVIPQLEKPQRIATKP